MLIFRIKLSVLKWKEDMECRIFLNKSLKYWRRQNYPMCVYYTLESDKVRFNIQFKEFFNKEFETAEKAKEFFEFFKKYLKREFSHFNELCNSYSKKTTICWLEQSNGQSIALVLMDEH